jgi:hypothetical protein
VLLIPNGKRYNIVRSKLALARCSTREVLSKVIIIQRSTEQLYLVRRLDAIMHGALEPNGVNRLSVDFGLEITTYENTTTNYMNTEDPFAPIIVNHGTFVSETAALGAVGIEEYITDFLMHSKADKDRNLRVLNIGASGWQGSQWCYEDGIILPRIIAVVNVLSNSFLSFLGSMAIRISTEFVDHVFPSQAAKECCYPSDPY